MLQTATFSATTSGIMMTRVCAPSLETAPLRTVLAVHIRLSGCFYSVGVDPNSGRDGEKPLPLRHTRVPWSAMVVQ